MTDAALRTLNDSGFPLQVAIHRRIEETKPQHGWSVRYVEHAWASPEDDRSGFIDLVLRHQGQAGYIAIECKRPRDSEWVFLHSDGNVSERAHAQAWISDSRAGRPPRFGWSHVTAEPTCPEVQFCAVRGQSTADRVTLLERTASELALATECLAREHRDYRRPDQGDVKFFISVLVTTATLTVAEFDPADISLKDGTLPSAAFTRIPFVRFRKQLGVNSPMLTPEQYMEASDISYLKERTVFVVSADAVVDFLAQVQVREPMPS